MVEAHEEVFPLSSTIVQVTGVELNGGNSRVNELVISMELVGTPVISQLSLKVGGVTSIKAVPVVGFTGIFSISKQSMVGLTKSGPTTIN